MDDSKLQISQIHTLEKGKGLQYLIDEAYKILGNPAVLFNMEYKLMFCAENVVTDDRLWNEIVDNGVFSDQSICFFKEECFIDAVANSKTITLLTSNKLKYERLYGRVFNGYKDTIADLIMVACDRPFKEQDAMLFESICEKMTQEISENEFYKSYGILYHENIICKLLNAEIGEKVVYTGHLSNLYEGLKSTLYVVAVDVSGCKDDKKEPAQYRDLFKEMYPELKYAVYSSYVVIIASNDRSDLNVNRDMHKLGAYFSEHNIRFGISSAFENLFNLRKYYEEAIIHLLS